MSTDGKIPDKLLLKHVEQRMVRKGTASKKVAASVIRGEVTLAGTISQEADRRAILKACNTVPGVMRVIDQIKVEVKKT